MFPKMDPNSSNRIGYYKTSLDEETNKEVTTEYLVDGYVDEESACVLQVYRRVPQGWLMIETEELDWDDMDRIEASLIEDFNKDVEPLDENGLELDFKEHF